MAQRGPKPKHRDIACSNKRCKLFGQKGHSNIVANGTYRTRSTGRVRRFLCRACGRAFTSRQGTFLYNLRTPQKTVLLALKLLAKGLGLRSTAEVLEVKLDTVRRWLALAAHQGEAVSHLLIKNLPLTQVQVDELWTFVKKNTQIPLRAAR